MEFYLATKKNEILSFAGKWMGLQNTILSEVSQVQKAKCQCCLSYVEYNLTQIQQYCEKQVTLKGGHIRDVPVG
jgi:hypothetical protein